MLVLKKEELYNYNFLFSIKNPAFSVGFFIFTVMKNIVFLSLLIFLSACFKKDKTPPQISLNGNSVVFVPLGSNYIDQGATAEDNRDGIITKYIVKEGSVNTEICGQYLIQYSVKDASGNFAPQIKRTVYVTLFNYHLNSVFNTNQLNPDNTIGNYFISVNADEENNNIIYLANVFNYGQELNLTAELSGFTNQSINIPYQILADTSYYGSGSINETGGEMIFSITKVSSSFTQSYILNLKR